MIASNGDLEFFHVPAVPPVTCNNKRNSYPSLQAADISTHPLGAGPLQTKRAVAGVLRREITLR